MRMLLVMAAVVALSSMAQGRVWTTIYRADEATPLPAVDPNHPTVYRDVMVGTRLAIVIGSDTDEYRWGSLQFLRSDYEHLSLNGRGYDERQFSYVGSCLPAAGKGASAWSFIGLETEGFEFFTDVNPVPGDWFIFDYRAERAGPCSLRLYDFNASPDVPVETLSLTHVRSRDFSGDATVDFADFAMLASGWRAGVSPDLYRTEIPFDLDSDGLIGVEDLILFGQYWLEQTDCNEPAGDPNRASDL